MNEVGQEKTWTTVWLCINSYRRFPFYGHVTLWETAQISPYVTSLCSHILFSSPCPLSSEPPKNLLFL